MHPVSTHGATKITMDSKERDYQERLRQAKAQGDGNPNVFGQQGPEQQLSTANNTPIEDTRNLSGDIDMGTSMTENATKNPDQFQSDELERRLQMYASASGNAAGGLNDRSQTGVI